MKKLLFLLSFLSCFIVSISQVPVVTRNTGSTVSLDQRLIIGKEFHLPRVSGVPTTAPHTLFGGVDTLAAQVYNILDSSIYYYVGGTTWIKTLKNSDITIPTWQQTLIAGSDLTQDNISNFHGYSWQWDSTGIFRVNMADNGSGSAYALFQVTSPGGDSETNMSVQDGQAILSASNNSLNLSTLVSISPELAYISSSRGGTQSDLFVYPDSISIGQNSKNVRIGTDSTATAQNVLYEDNDGVLHRSNIAAVNYWIKKAGTSNKFYLPSGDSASVGTSAVNNAFTVNGGISVLGQSYIAIDPGGGIKNSNTNTLIGFPTGRPSRIVASTSGTLVWTADSGRFAVGSYTYNPSDSFTRQFTVKLTSEFKDTIVYTGAPTGTAVFGLGINSLNQIVKTAAIGIPTLQEVTTAGNTTDVGITLTAASNVPFPTVGVTEFDSSGRLHVRTANFKTYSFSTNLIASNGAVIDTLASVSGILNNSNSTNIWTAQATFNMTPTATANFGVLNVGTAFDGSTSGFFAGSAGGTLIAGNAVSGFAGDMINLGAGGVPFFRVDGAGGTRIAQKLIIGTGASSASALLHLSSSAAFTTSGAPGVGGFAIRIDNATLNTSNASGGTVAQVNANSFGTPTLTSTGGAYTATIANNVMIVGAPVAGSGFTIGTGYALNVSGNVLLSSTVTTGAKFSTMSTSAQNSSLGSGTVAFTTSANPSGTGFGLGIQSNTYTTTGSGGTITTASVNSIGTPTYVNNTNATTVTTMYNFSVAAATVAGAGMTFTTNYAFGVLSGNSNFVGNVNMFHLIGTSTAPTIAAGTGAGTTPTVSITGTDLAGYISVTTGTVPTLSATVVTITFNAAYGAAPRAVILTPANSNTALLTGVTQVFVDQAGITTTTFAITAGTTALTGSTAYKFYYTVIQ